MSNQENPQASNGYKTSSELIKLMNDHEASIDDQKCTYTEGTILGYAEGQKDARSFNESRMCENCRFVMASMDEINPERDIYICMSGDKRLPEDLKEAVVPKDFSCKHHKFGGEK